MTDSSENGKTGRGDSLQTAKDPEAAMDTHADHDDATGQTSGNGSPESEQFDDSPNFCF